MACSQWKESWVAHLYDELTDSEARELKEHLVSCRACGRHLEELAVSRRALQEARPAVPATPGVVVLRPRKLLQPLWAYAAGAACAMLVFAVGLLAGYNMPGSVADGDPTLQASVPSAGEQALEARFEQVLLRVDRLEQEDSARPATEAREACVSPDRFDDEIRRLEREYDVQRARDVQFLLEEMTAAELRTGAYLDETRQALQMVAVKSDPRFRER